MERINLYKFKWDKLDTTRQKLQAKPKNENANWELATFNKTFQMMQQKI